MTAVAEEVQIPEQAVEEPVPAEAPPDAPAPRRIRAEVEAEIREALEKYAARRILARQLCTGEADVRNGRMCNSGTQKFMADCMLHPPGERVVDLNRQQEPQVNKEAGEKLLRQDVWRPFGDPGCDLGDFTMQGLTKRLARAAASDKKWADTMRARIIEQTGSYISVAKRDEAFRKLEMEPWIPHRHMTGTIYIRYAERIDEGLTRQQQGQALQERLIEAVRQVLGSDENAMRYARDNLRVEARDI